MVPQPDRPGWGVQVKNHMFPIVRRKVSKAMDLPREKGDVDSAKRLAFCTLDELEPFLEELLIWLQDANWPVTRVVAPILARFDARILPPIRRILATDDDIWKYWTLTEVVAKLKPSVRELLMEELRRLVEDPSPGERAEEVDCVAREILQREWIETVPE